MRLDFELKSNPIAYLKTIAKNYWLMEVRKNKNHIEPLDEWKMETNDSYLIDKERKSLISDLLDQISEDCREILTLWSKKYKIKEIALKVDSKSEGYIKKKKHLCLKKLIALVESKPNLKAELRNYV